MAGAHEGMGALATSPPGICGPRAGAKFRVAAATATDALRGTRPFDQQLLVLLRVREACANAWPGAHEGVGRWRRAHQRSVARVR